MKTISRIAITFSLLAMTLAPALAAIQPKVTVHPTASVQADVITLGDIAELSPSPLTSKLSARLAATVIGCAPLTGVTRQLTRGDIILKLRQAGIDPATVDLEGATAITVSSSAAPAPAAAVATSVILTPTPAPQPAAAHPAGPAVRAGDPVDIVLVDGPVTVHAKGYASTAGAIGDQITVRRDDAPHPLTATIIAAGQVELTE